MIKYSFYLIQFDLIKVEFDPLIFKINSNDALSVQSLLQKSDLTLVLEKIDVNINAVT